MTIGKEIYSEDAPVVAARRAYDAAVLALQAHKRSRTDPVAMAEYARLRFVVGDMLKALDVALEISHANWRKRNGIPQ